MTCLSCLLFVYIKYFIVKNKRAYRFLFYNSFLEINPKIMMKNAEKLYPSGDIYYNQELKQQRCPTPLFYTVLC